MREEAVEDGTVVEETVEEEGGRCEAGAGWQSYVSSRGPGLDWSTVNAHVNESVERGGLGRDGWARGQER